MHCTGVIWFFWCNSLAGQHSCAFPGVSHLQNQSPAQPLGPWERRLFKRFASPAKFQTSTVIGRGRVGHII